MNASIDINCDMGEGCGDDAALMPHISSANIACGYHAGDAATMRATITLAARHGVAIGAHPSYRDRDNFGRTDVELSPNEIRTLILEQLELFAAACREVGVAMGHVKPHGALYNRSARDVAVAQAIAKAVREFDPDLSLYGLAQSHSTEAARSLGLKAADEAFADRAYEPDGSLVSRKMANALINSPEIAAAQALRIALGGGVVAVDGSNVPLSAETICVHGDGPNAVAIVRTIWSAFELAGVAIKAP